MEWMLIALINGSPIETNIRFDGLSTCLKFEEGVRGQQIDAFNEWRSWASQNPEISRYPESEQFQQFRIGADTVYTCIPVAAEE